jgi:hypothetical protein
MKHNKPKPTYKPFGTPLKNYSKDIQSKLDKLKHRIANQTKVSGTIEVNP